MNGVAFFLGVYREQASAKTRVLLLRDLYPESPILCISDGVDDSDFTAFCWNQGVNYFVGDRIKIKGYCGAWTERYFRFFIESTPSEVTTLIKIDPGDTGIHRCFKYLPDPSVDIFGTVFRGSRPNVCGGCIGYRRKAVERFLECGLLNTIELGTYRRFSEKWMRTGEEPEATEIAFQDEIVFKVAQQLELKIERFAEVYANMRRSIPNAEKKLALSHPFFYPGDLGYEPQI